METQKLNLNDLTPAQKQQLLLELESEKKAEDARKDAERKVYKELASKAVDDDFDKITRASMELSILKAQIFKTFMTLVKTKSELYNVSNSQQSHTFSNAAGDKRIRIGYRVFDRWDDTLEVGIAKVKEYLESLAKDSQAKEIMSLVNNLLKRDEKGNMRPSRVLELIKLSREIGNDKFQDGVEIIQKAHRVEVSSYFIEAEWMDTANSWHYVPLSIASVEFPVEDRKALFPEEFKEDENK